MVVNRDDLSDSLTLWFENRQTVAAVRRTATRQPMTAGRSQRKAADLFAQLDITHAPNGKKRTPCQVLCLENQRLCPDHPSMVDPEAAR